MHYFIIILILFSSLCNSSFAQNSSQDKQKKTIQKFVDAYNQQNYWRMKKTFFGLAKVLPIKGNLKQSFEPIYNKNGKVKIGNMKFLSNNGMTAELVYVNDTTESDFLNFFFNKKNKIKGVWFKEPDFLYPKKNTEATNKISDQIKAAKIDSLLKKEFVKGLNGNVIVVNNREIIYKNAFGYANYDSKELLDDSSVFEIASCSKQFTAMAIMILAEQGKLKYSDDIQLYIPDLPYKGISIENLLTHTSGLPDYMELFAKHWDKNKFATNQDMVTLFKQYKPKTYFAPNERFDYSNTGYALLSLIIEKASGLTYNEYLEKSIFKPLNMINTRVYNTRRSKNEKLPNYAYGYIYSDKTKTYTLPDSMPEHNYVCYLDPITGDGAVNTTILDLVKWDKALRENILVSKASIEKAFTQYKVKSGKEIPYGYGQQINYAEGKERIVFHGGGWPGYVSHILHFVDRPIMIAILMNNENEDPLKLTDQIIRILLN